MSNAPVSVPSVRPFATFVGEVSAVRPIGHSLRRVTCRGAAFRDFADNGWDQRIKLILPLPTTGFATFPTDDDWYEAWRVQPEHEQNPLRTYTVRAVRADLGEVDVDMVTHGTDGPASAWVSRVAVGDPVALLGPHAGYDGDHGGVEFQPPRPGEQVLLAADETAQPAVATILEQLPPDTRGTAVIEMPHPDDVIELSAPAGVRIEWLIRGDRPVGVPMAAWFADHAPSLLAAVAPAEPTPPDDDAGPGSSDDAGNDAGNDESNDEEVVWDVTGVEHRSPVRAWIAGEAGMVTRLRRLLVRDLGVDRRAVSFMGYWRLPLSDL